MKCSATNASGGPCGAPEEWVDEALGLCRVHQPGGHERQVENAMKGGEALKRKHDGGGFAIEDLPPVTTLEDAKLALDAIRVAVLTRRITDREANSASKAVSEWVKAEASAQTQRLVTELKAELERKTGEIEVLRQQLATQGRAQRSMRVVKA
jgi:hypothetical protein